MQDDFVHVAGSLSSVYSGYSYMQESDVEEDRGEEINEADSAKADEGNEERPRNANSHLLGHNHGRVEAFSSGTLTWLVLLKILQKRAMMHLIRCW